LERPDRENGAASPRLMSRAAGKPFGRKSWPKKGKFQVIKCILKMKRHHISSFLTISLLVDSYSNGNLSGHRLRVEILLDKLNIVT